MGQSKNQRKYRDGDSSSGHFLSPRSGTISAPIQFLPYAVGVFGIAFLASCLTASIVTPIQNSNASTSEIKAEVDSVAYNVAISTNNGSASSTISKDISATTAGSFGVVTDNLVISSNTPNGYHVYLSMLNNTNGQNLYNTSDSTYYIPPVYKTSGEDATFNSPANLANENTWGVAVSSTYNAAFDAASAYASDSVIAETTKFAPVPAAGSSSELFYHNPGTGSQTVTVPVYFGYRVNSALPSGTYQNTVVYTAFADSTGGADVASYTGNINYKTGGTVTFTTSLYTDRALSTSDATVMIGGKACTVTEVKRKDAGTNDAVQVVCTAPAQDKPGDYTASITMSGYGYQATKTIAYDTDGLDGIKTMQAMTTAHCNAWATEPAAFTSGSAPEYRFKTNSAIDVTDTTNSVLLSDFSSSDYTNYWTTYSTANAASYGYIANINTNVPETYLKDTRDGNWYRIRKFPDGNCWMTENLRLVFDSDQTNSVGVVNSAGNIVAQSPVVTINADNTNVGTGWNESDFTSVLAYTEHVNTVATNNNSRWASSTEPTNPHPTTYTAGTDDQWTNDASARSMNFARSLYNGTTRSDCTKPGDVANTGTNNCFIRDGDEQTIGTYYNWRTATVGTGTVNTSTNGTNATGSICPKGWQLPVNGNSSTDKSWAKLINGVYGGNFNNGANADARNNSSDGANNASFNKNEAGYKVWALTAQMRMAPLSLPFSGYYFYGGSVSYVASEGLWWSSTAYSGPSAYYLLASAGLLVPQYSIHKGLGLTVRCVAQ